jgi:uncharacterized protein YjbI with pentapeptide repeats
MTDAERLATEGVFQGVTFGELELDEADLSGKDFSRCTFRGVKLRRSRWDGVRLEECLFEDCDLSRLRPGPRTAAGVTFRRTKLMGVELAKLGTPVLAFEECDLRYAAFLDLNLKGTVFRGCKLGEATFSGCDLSQASFAGADLGGAVFESCLLAGADLRTARGAYLDPAKNKVRGARISLETAGRLAAALGMEVEGLEEG